MNFPSKEELEKAYRAAMLGSESPDLIYYYCEECKKGFTITRFKQDVCDHLRKRLEETKK